MQPSFFQNWGLSPDDAEKLQLDLATRVVREDQLPSAVRLVAGADVAYEKNGDRLFAAVVILDAITLDIVETAGASGVVAFPYVPGLFSFRELPPLCEALQRLNSSPDLIICDAQGVAHPRRFGLASHLGVLFDVPTIGCGKTCLLGSYSPPGANRGNSTPLVDRNEVVGCVLRTQTNIKPLFVSIGHRVSLDTAKAWILRLSPQYRQPEPIRQANRLANTSRASFDPCVQTSCYRPN